MMSLRFHILLTLLVAVGLMDARIGQSQTRIHGADSLFVSLAVKLAWAVLKGKTEADTTVVIRVVNVTGDYRFLSVDALDPFTKDRAVLDRGRRFDRTTDLSIVRARFADHPSAEISLFRTEDGLRQNKPELVVYYLGVPDTTPEFQSADAMNAYLDKMLGIAR
jgi:hypothetical protein